MTDYYPKRIVCLTEESVEYLYLLGLEDRIVGVSSFVERPPQAKLKPRVCTFTHAQTQKIKDLNPDLVLGFSDIQREVAKELIHQGLNVFITNQRSLEDIFYWMVTVGSLVGKPQESRELVQKFQNKVQEIRTKGASLVRRPRVYFEEWPEPLITGIHWVSELVGICGGEDVFQEKSRGSLGSDRIVLEQDVLTAAPDMIFACWCGKKVEWSRFESLKSTPAYQNKKIFELDPAIFLQPGPALFLEGLDRLFQFFLDYNEGTV